VATERFQTDDGQVLEAEVRPITIICHPDNVGDVEPLDRLVLDPETTLYHADRLSPGGRHAWTNELLELLFKQNPPPSSSLAYRHALGLIDLTLKLQDMGVRVAWRYPETYLHPAAQLQLADVLLALQARHP
jgi:hypothetical protein